MTERDPKRYYNLGTYRTHCNRRSTPPVLDDLGLLPAIELLVRRNSDDGPQVRIDVTGHPRRLDMQSELAVFHIIQEARLNIRRPAAATIMQTQFASLRNSLLVTIHDQGAGLLYHQTGPSGKATGD